jgi:hypothetical protein
MLNLIYLYYYVYSNHLFKAIMGVQEYQNTTGGRPASDCWAPKKERKYTVSRPEYQNTTGGRPASDCWAPKRERKYTVSRYDNF